MTVRTALGRVVTRLGHIALAAAAVAGAMSALLFGAVRLGHVQTITLVSGSMHPTISVGDLVISTPVDADEVEVGDIITVRSAYTGELVTHRVTGVGGTSEPGMRAITMKGDANSDEDQEVYVVSRVFKHRVTLPYVGRAVEVLSTPPGVYFGIVTLVAALGFTFLPKEDDREELERQADEPAPV